MSLKFQDMAENRCRSGGRSSLFLPLHGLASYHEGAARKILCVLLFSAIDTKKKAGVRGTRRFIMNTNVVYNPSHLRGAAVFAAN